MKLYSPRSEKEYIEIHLTKHEFEETERWVRQELKKKAKDMDKKLRGHEE